MQPSSSTQQGCPDIPTVPGGTKGRKVCKLVSIVGNTRRSIEYYSLFPRGQIPPGIAFAASSRLLYVEQSWRSVAKADGLMGCRILRAFVHGTTQRGHPPLSPTHLSVDARLCLPQKLSPTVSTNTACVCSHSDETSEIRAGFCSSRACCRRGSNAPTMTKLGRQAVQSWG